MDIVEEKSISELIANSIIGKNRWHRSLMVGSLIEKKKKDACDKIIIIFTETFLWSLYSSEKDHRKVWEKKQIINKSYWIVTKNHLEERWQVVLNKVT